MQVRLNTRSDCELAVSIYPTFAYNAAGGGGWGTVTHMQDGEPNDTVGVHLLALTVHRTSLHHKNF